MPNHALRLLLVKLHVLHECHVGPPTDRDARKRPVLPEFHRFSTWLISGETHLCGVVEVSRSYGIGAACLGGIGHALAQIAVSKKSLLSETLSNLTGEYTEKVLKARAAARPNDEVDVIALNRHLFDPHEKAAGVSVTDLVYQRKPFKRSHAARNRRAVRFQHEVNRMLRRNRSLFSAGSFVS